MPRATSKLPPGPARPGLRVGVEQEGLFKGEPTLVVLGNVPWTRIAEALSRHKVSHVFWEVGPGEKPWRSVRRLFERPVSKGKGVTLDVGLEDLAAVPHDLRSRVELMVRVPSWWTCVDTFKVNYGGFRAAWLVQNHGDWQFTKPSDYTSDEVLWP